MSTLSQLFDLSEQIYYVQCGFCTTMLLVMVTASSLVSALYIYIYMYLLLPYFSSGFLFSYLSKTQVSVPCNSLSMVVTVRCGHCTALFSVNMNMMNASLVPFQNLWNCLNHNEVYHTDCLETSLLMNVNLSLYRTLQCHRPQSLMLVVNPCWSIIS